MEDLSKLIKAFLLSTLNSFLQPLGRSLKRVVYGLIVIVTSLVFIVIGLITLLIALFLHLAAKAEIVMPAISAGAIGIIIGAMLFLIGLSLMRR